jgi:indolepyruvate ferredoxin oxidoreductase beta subunit
MSEGTYNILIAGVGGQGVLTASDVLAVAALIDGRDVKKSELHGMAQRGGSVVSHVRFGPEVHSPVIPAGQANFMAAFERLEALRYSRMLAPGSNVVMSKMEFAPIDDPSGTDYPVDVEERLRAIGANVFAAPARMIAEDAGSRKSAGVVLMGVLSGLLPLSMKSWNEALREVIGGRMAETNMEAFRLGRSWMSSNFK